MKFDKSRACPLCGNRAKGLTFPYITRFNSATFHYLNCDGCSSVFVDPIPDNETFGFMYAKSEYHDRHYDGLEGGAYTESARLLKQYLPDGAKVLDYGCGVGAFLKALKIEGFMPYGVEFDEDAARFAGKNAKCETMTVGHFFSLPEKVLYDAIHLGDVLEHLPDPDATLEKLLKYLKPDGVLFVEGPLEVNPSPVFMAARLFGVLKHFLRPKFVASHKPTHLFRTGAKQQFKYFMKEQFCLDLVTWRIYETGWPYANGGVIKNSIASFAICLGGKKILGITFGNRFQGIFTYMKGEYVET